ncbi:hypothetical protein FFLO_06790 [Filobasidium floriforme]|uniref:Major facilitator superfamily (MFS) profile domain-containing protein n=1 Tax=Filobasidium floriforme TaxID=5210 RepID=A0A8K0JE68_9TREE|nr:general substrate transporter [Filobasidium floriforme]KAG7527584.1 hypothetical protein FFLO_06790 [Filobasidium floriforme]KAH8077637.1 general substrate transporter [Filobasidium floriforme]
MNTSTIEDIGKADGLVHSDDKHEVEMLEHEHKPSDAAATAGIDMRGQELTGYEDLTLFQTLMKFKKTSLICFAVTFSACAEGYEIGMANNINANPGFNHAIGSQVNPVDGERILSASQLAVWTPISTTGQVLGQVGFPFISSWFGRKWSLFLIWLLATIAITMQTIATKDAVWAASKIFTGMSVGALQTVVPMYVCELAPTKIRGSLISFYNFWFQLGNFFPPIVFQCLKESGMERDWKLPIYTQWATIGVIGVVFFFAPESPVWCAQKGKRDRGIAILTRLNGKIDGYNAEKQYDILSRSAEYEKAQNAEVRKEYWFNVFLGSNLLRLIISTWTTLSFQMLGLGLFLSYASVFYTAAGVDDPFIIVIINNCVTLGSIVPIIIFADKIGRRWVCIIGLGLMWIACLLVGILGIVDKGKVVNALLVLFTCIWTLGLQTAATAAYGYLAETSTQSLREYTAGWAYACSTIFGATWGILIPYMVNEAEWNWNLKTGFFFFGVGSFFAVGAWFVLPETSKRTSAELDELFARKIKPWRFHKTKTAIQLAAEEEKEQQREIGEI